jgi:hypothetical protein
VSRHDFGHRNSFVSGHDFSRADSALPSSHPERASAREGCLCSLACPGELTAVPITGRLREH